MKRWKRIRREQGPQIPLFDLEFHYMENPRNQSVLKALVLRAKDTVNVIALTADQEVLLVKQYRFGVQDFVMELPAGLIDRDEDPISTAKRELEEETGYISEEWHYLGFSYINPAYVNNGCHHFVATNAIQKGVLKLDDSETIQVSAIPLGSVPNYIRKGIIRDAISIACLSRFLDIRG
jgi:ADP-ribose pyrophosphatase